jgi:hypothetical protein
MHESRIRQMPIMATQIDINMSSRFLYIVYTCACDLAEVCFVPYQPDSIESRSQTKGATIAEYSEVLKTTENGLDAACPVLSSVKNSINRPENKPTTNTASPWWIQRFIITTWRIMETILPITPKTIVEGPMACPDISAAKPIKNDTAIVSWILQFIAEKTSSIKSISGLIFIGPIAIISITL